MKHIAVGVAIRILVVVGCVMDIISSLCVLELLTNGATRDVVVRSIEFGVDHAVVLISAQVVELE